MRTDGSSPQTPAETLTRQRRTCSCHTRSRAAATRSAPPADQRDRAEAAALLDVAPRTIQDLHTDGLLPNSRTLTGTWRVYLRADLERVKAGPRKGLYLDRAALRAGLAET